MKSLIKDTIIARLQREILEAEGFKKPVSNCNTKLGFPTIERNFPNQVFPSGAIHEFLIPTLESAACTSAFISALLGKLQPKGFYIWLSKQKQIFPNGLTNFGLAPHQIIFINLPKQRDLLWATEEALKCKSLSGVISELDEISFAQSQRLQLTVEKSKVTGFILRPSASQITATACTARWQIKPALSYNYNNLPGVGFAKWQVNLLKVRNGNPANFEITWHNGQFNSQHEIEKPILSKAISV